MTSTVSLPATVKILTQEPVAKIADRQTYWIRIVADKQSAEPCYAIAAMRCENREEIHWLCGCRSTAGEAARLMRTGFPVAADAPAILTEIIQVLLKNGDAVVVDATSCTAVAA